jgi:hypothetical protein
MRWNLSQVRAMACHGPLCSLVILLAAAAGPALAQDAVVYPLGRIGLHALSVLHPALVYRPIDTFSGRPGGDAMGMGGAYLASASGAAALGWNVAGLADLEHLSFTFDGYSRAASAGVGAYPDSIVITGQSTLRFLSYRPSLKGGFVPSFIAAAGPLWTSGERRLVGAFGWRHYAEMAVPEQAVSDLVPGGVGATFPIAFSMDRSERGSLEAFSPALAFRAGRTVSLGAVLNVLEGGVRATTDERWAFYGATTRAHSKYSGLSPEFGGRVSFGPSVSLGLHLVPGYTLKVRDGAYSRRAAAIPPSPQYIVTATFADYDLTIPAAFGAGVAFRPSPRLLIAADMNAQSWSKAKVTYTKAPPDSVGLPLADVTTLHFGAEYKVLRTSWGEVPVRVGFRTAPLGYLDVDRRDLQPDTISTPQGSLFRWSYHGKQPKSNAYSFGASLDTSGIRYDVGFERISYEQNKWFFDTPYDQFLNPGMTTVKVKQKVSKIRLSATYTF